MFRSKVNSVNTRQPNQLYLGIILSVKIGSQAECNAAKLVILPVKKSLFQQQLFNNVKMISLLHILTTLVAFCGIFFWILIRSKPHTIGTKRSISIVFYFKWLLAYVLVRLGKRQAKIVNTEVMDKPKKLPEFPHVSYSIRIHSIYFHRKRFGNNIIRNHSNFILLFQYMISDLFLI